SGSEPPSDSFSFAPGSARTSNMMAVSSALRAVIPACENQMIASSGGFSPSRIPFVLINPYVPLNPTTPQQAAGKRHDPIASVSTVAQHKPVATAAAEPDDDPPGMYSAFQGFFTGPK